MLYLTNGDMAGGLVQHAIAGRLIPAGTVLPWRDVLHEGPVRAGLSLDELSRERAAFIAECGWGPPASVEKDFRERDEQLKRSQEHDEVVLWFEHDLYDQLQLIQLLDWLAAHPHPKLSLICEAEYVGSIKPARAGELFASRNRVSDAQLAEGRAAWAAFTAPDPIQLERVPCSHLRFLGAALRRHLEEFPWLDDGLSRVERRVLDSLRDGSLRFGRLFPKVNGEDPVFLGDAVLAWHLERMQGEGLLAKEGDLWSAIPRAERSRRPRWLGGVLVTEESPWRWDAARGAIRVLR